MSQAQIDRLNAIDAALAQAAAESAALRPLLPVDPVKPTYALTAKTATINEGDIAVFELRTTGLVSGDSVSFHLAGTAANQVDIAAAELGAFVVDTTGFAFIEVPIRADAATEGDEVLECFLDNQESSASIVVKDTSQTPPEDPLAEYKLQAVSVNRSAVICGATWHGRVNYPTYNRFPDKEVLTPTSSTTYVSTANFATWGERFFSRNTYSLFVDGVFHTDFLAPLTGHLTAVKVNVGALSQGWHLFSVAMIDTTESCIPWYVFIHHGGILSSEDLALMPMVTANHHYLRSQSTVFWHGLFPAGFKAIAEPLLPIPKKPIPVLASQAQLQFTMIAPCSPDMDRYRPKIDDFGIWSGINWQAYNIPQLTARGYQRIDALDGPRNVGTITMATQISPSIVVPGDAENLRPRRWYVLEPGRFCRVDLDGRVTTLAGHYRDVPGGPMKLRGDWSRVPNERRDFWESWGFAWDWRTLVIDQAAPQNPAEGNLRPHTLGPVALVANTRHGVINKIEFSATQHAPEPIVTELVIGLGDVWKIITDPTNPDIFYVSERANHRVTKRSCATGELLEVMLSGAPMAHIDPVARTIVRHGTLAELRLQPIVCPEGMFLVGRELYVGSWAQQWIVAVNLDTKEVRVVTDKISGDSNSHFVDFTVSNGGFGAKGTIYYTTWSSINAGAPIGIPLNYNNKNIGPGLPFRTFGYSCAAGIDEEFGMLLFSSSSEGLFAARAADDGQDVVNWQDYVDMMDEYDSNGLYLRHGNYAYGHNGLAIPWDKSPRLARLFKNVGHIQ